MTSIDFYNGADAPTAKPTYGYYRQPDGWITVSPATNTDELRYRRGGWEPLTQYGRFEMASPYMANHPLEPLFMRDGAHELTVDQVVKQGLYIDPPVIPRCRTPLGAEHKRHTRNCMNGAPKVEFPQVADLKELGPFSCPFGCGRNDLPTVAARDQHASVMHGPEKSDERTGKSLAEALILGLGGKNPADPAMAALVAHMERMERELEELRARPAAPRRRGANRPKVAVPA